MKLFSRIKTKFNSIKTNTKLALKAEQLLFRNRGMLKEGDSIPILQTRKLIKHSNMPKILKDRYKYELFSLFNRHLNAGKTWVDFREMISIKEKNEKRKMSKEEKDQLWQRWNKDQRGY